MATNSGIQFPVVYVRWTVFDSGEPFRCIASDKFTFQNAKFRLHYKLHDEENFLHLSFEDACRKPYSVAVHVEDRTGKIFPELSIKRIYIEPSKYTKRFNYLCIWNKTELYIALVPEYNRKHGLRFLVILIEDDILAGENTTSATKIPLPCLESLSEDLDKLLDSNSDPDVQLNCEGHTMKAHKNILCARSPVLAKMLQSDMVEGKTGVVNIQDIDVDIFEQFIRYLYTGKMDQLTVESAIRLFEAGDMYSVLSLAGRCCQFLIDNLTVENACDVLAVADLHSKEEMVETVIEFMLEMKVPLTDDPWSAFCESHPKLANKVYSRFCKKFCK